MLLRTHRAENRLEIFMIRLPHRQSPCRAFATIVLAVITIAALPSGTVAQSRFEFLAPPSTERYHIYRVDTRTGAMAVCWFNEVQTECLQGTGLAGAQAPGSYSLRRSANPAEKGVFRVELNSGSISNCFFRRSQGFLECTPPVR
jgi:hypothetical protein